ncbi:MAG: hypothetical protein KDK38_15230 [Leptospiraceae bacterium]|nr:hypothetical protein [Leptospiraceae bacterium]
MRDLVVKKFSSFEQEEKSNREYMHSLTADERFEIAFEIVKSVHGDLSKCPDVREYHREQLKKVADTDNIISDQK